MHNILKMVGLGESCKWEIAGSTKSLDVILKENTLLLEQAGQINLHYTCHHIDPATQRDFSLGEWLFLDFDKIENYNESLALKYLDAFTLTTGLDPKYVWVISSGNGVHLLVKILPYSLLYLESHKSTYSKLCEDLEKTLVSLGLTGELDRVFQKTKSLRLPNTINRKPNQPDRRCVLLKEGEPLLIDFLTQYRQLYDSSFSLDKETKRLENLSSKSNLPAIIGANGAISTIATSEEILAKCGFTQNLKTDMAYLPREEWLRAVGLLTSLNMEAQAHEWSSMSATYKQTETESIIESSKQKGLHPTSCKKIKETYSESLTKACDTCQFKSCGSPAKLFEDETMKSYSQGFYEYFEKNGEMKRGKINYVQLSLFCYNRLNIFNVKEHDSVYSWNHEQLIYEEQTKHSMAKTFNSLVRPAPLDTTEFLNKGIDNMKIHHTKNEEEVLPPSGYIPLANGWLNALTGDLEPYTPKWLVTHKVPVNFDPLATCPTFEKFLQERIGDADTIQVLLQYICYALAGIKHPNRKILVLEGPAGTGKTTLVGLFTRLFGHLYASAQLQHLTGRFEMSIFEGKRLVYFDEAPQERDTVLIEVLKNISGNSEIRVERKNQDAKTIQNFARMIISCNEIPRGGAMDSGFMDRLLIVPMHSQIETRNHADVEAMFSETSGILNLVLKQFKHLQLQDFQINPTAVTKKQSDIYQLENEPVAAFIEQEIDFVACPLVDSKYIKENSVLASERTAVSLKNFRSAFCHWAKDEAPYYKEMTLIHLRKRLENLLKTLYRKDALKPKIVQNSQYYIAGMRFKNLNNYEKPNAADKF